MAPYPLADDGQRNFVDLNTIPNAIVDRIEVHPLARQVGNLVPIAVRGADLIYPCEDRRLLVVHVAQIEDRKVGNPGARVPDEGFGEPRCTRDLMDHEVVVE